MGSAVTRIQPPELHSVVGWSQPQLVSDRQSSSQPWDGVGRNSCPALPALLYGMEAWKKLSKAEIQNLEKIQGKALKRIFGLPITIPYIGLIIETGVWPAEQRINYSSLMLYHNIVSSNKNRLVKQIILEQRAQNH